MPAAAPAATAKHSHGPHHRHRAGKASAAMVRALEDHWSGPLEGLVITRYGYELPCQRIEIVQAAHPVPDAAGLQAAERIRQRVTGLTLAYKQAVNSALLHSGANISEMNCVRRHLTSLKGGRLGTNPRNSLDNNDTHSFFQALGDSVVTGPTLTNVNDFRAILIEG